MRTFIKTPKFKSRKQFFRVYVKYFNVKSEIIFLLNTRNIVQSSKVLHQLFVKIQQFTGCGRDIKFFAVNNSKCRGDCKLYARIQKLIINILSPV